MLEYIATHQVTYCIVHKVDRLARNRLDDVDIHRHLIDAGVQLVSATENIDDTPSGMLLHGIMSSIAEFYSRNLAAEVTKGMTQKVAAGGTPSRAPIGYRNVRKCDAHGREYRTVEVDPDRAPLIRWVFDTYAKGEHTVPGLLAEATARGLATVPTPKRPSGPVGRSTFFKLLRNPYYIGQVRYQGALHPGAHEPIVDPETWQQVQTLLGTRATAGERRRKHDHYLKGTLYCGTCNARLQLDYARNKQGIRYAYYICTGRATKRTSCTRKAVPVGVAEQLVAECYQHIAITEQTYQQLAQQVKTAFDERLAERSQAIDDLTTTKQRLEAEADKLLEAHFANAIDLPTLKRHQDRIRIALADVTKRLDAERHDHEGPRQHLATALQLLADCAQMYARTDDRGKRLANQAFYQRILITEDEKAAIQLNEPFAALAPNDVRCSSTSDLVGDTGIEPVTSSVSGKRATAAPIARAPGGARRNGADDGTRTRDPHLGKVMLYQLSHVRTSARPTKEHPSARAVHCANERGPSWPTSPAGATDGRHRRAPPTGATDGRHRRAPPVGIVDRHHRPVPRSAPLPTHRERRCEQFSSLPLFTTSLSVGEEGAITAGQEGAMTASENRATRLRETGRPQQRRPPTGRSSHPQMHGSPPEACNILEVRLRGRAPRVETPAGDWRSGSALPSHGRGHWFDPSIAHGEVHAVPPGKPWTTHCGRGSVGRASPCQGEGRGFESRRPLRERRTRHHCRERLFHKMRKHRGGLAERRGNGLQSRVHGFESRTHLHRRLRARQGRATGPTPRAIGAAVARFPDTEEVTGSIPVSPTRWFGAMTHRWR